MQSSFIEEEQESKYLWEMIALVIIDGVYH